MAALALKTTGAASGGDVSKLQPVRLTLALCMKQNASETETETEATRKKQGRDRETEIPGMQHLRVGILALLWCCGWRKVLAIN